MVFLDCLSNSKVEQARFLELLKRNASASDDDIVDYLDLLKQDDDELATINLDLLKDPRLVQFSEKLAGLLSNKNEIDDLESIWFELTEDDQKEFIELVNGNDELFDELIREWKPWWLRAEWQQAVVDQEEDPKDQDDDDEDTSRHFPAFYTKFERINKLTSV